MCRDWQAGLLCRPLQTESFDNPFCDRTALDDVRLSLKVQPVQWRSLELLNNRDVGLVDYDPEARVRLVDRGYGQRVKGSDDTGNHSQRKNAPFVASDDSPVVEERQRALFRLLRHEKLLIAGPHGGELGPVELRVEISASHTLRVQYQKKLSPTVMMSPG